MLVLSRKPQECIVIGEDVCVYIVAIEGNKVKIGIKAPKEVVVMRDELLNRGERESRLDLLEPQSRPPLLKVV